MARAARAAKPAQAKAWIGRHNYIINSETVLRDLYRLLNVVLADEALARVATEDQDLLIQLRDQFVEDELVHLLISTAVMNRSHDDHMAGPRKDEHELSFRDVDRTCGRLTVTMGGKTVEDGALTLREAANKIIHAENITVETLQIDGLAFQPLPQTVILEGRLGKKEWVAVLNVPDYARASIMNFRDL